MLQIVLPDILKPFPLSQQLLQSRQRGEKELNPSISYFISSHEPCPAQCRSCRLHDSEHSGPCTDGAPCTSRCFLEIVARVPLRASTFKYTVSLLWKCDEMLSFSPYSSLSDLSRRCKFTSSRGPGAL